MRLTRVALAVALLSGTAAICIAQPPAGQAPGSSTYLDRECGFKFTYSKIWTVTKERIPEAEDACDYRITFTHKDSNGVLFRHRVEVAVFDYEFEGLEKEQGGKFELKDGVWYEDRGIAGKGEAKEIRGINWIGLNTPEGPARCFGKEGYEGIGDRPTASLFGLTVKRMAELEGGECEDADMEGIQLLLPTFEFVPIVGGPVVPR